MPKFSQDASNFSPNPPKIDPRAIQKASWSPSWPIVLKRYDLERPTSSQNAPKSGRKTLQSVPNPSQMEPQDFPKSDFPALFGFVCFWSQICIFVLQLCGRMCLFLKSRPSKFMRPRSVLLTSTRLCIFSKRYQKSSKNPPETLPKSNKNRGKNKKNLKKTMEKAKTSEQSQKMR